MYKEKIILLNYENKNIEISISDIKSFQRYKGVDIIESKGHIMIGGEGRHEYIELTTKIGKKHKILRNCKNDKQILDLILK